MYLSSIYFLTTTLLLTLTSASPLPNPTSKLIKRATNEISLTFIGGPASYTLTIPNDNTWHPTTDEELNISKIKSSSDIDVLQSCQFQTHDPPAVPATATYVLSADDGAVDVGPPQPILAVKCLAG